MLLEFELEKGIKLGYDVMNLVVEEIESEKEIPQEVKPIIEEFVDIVLEEIPHGLPPTRDIQHLIDLIPFSVLPNKSAYRMSPKKHEELKRQVDDLIVENHRILFGLSPSFLVHYFPSFLYFICFLFVCSRCI